MPANVLIFDADYVAELTSRMTTACELMSEAVSSLKSAQNHENWKCKERVKILEDFDTLNLKLGRLDSGVNDTTRILGGSVSRFAALESKYDSQAASLSEELTNNHGFSATVSTGGGTPVPESGTPGGQSSPSGGGTSGRTSGASGGSGASHGAGTRGSESGGSGSQSGGTSGGTANSGAASGATTSLLRGVKPGSSPSSQQTDTQSGQAAESGSGTSANTGSISGGGGAMNINLPVTYIPDNPGAAAKGIRSTQAIADAAVSSVVAAMTDVLASPGADISSSAVNLVEAYNAGKSIFESSAAIMASPTKAHTTERLAMAEGIVTLAGSSSSGFSFLNHAGSSEVLSTASGRTSFTHNAGTLRAAIQDNSEASEFSNLLGVFAGSNGDSASAIINLSGSESSGAKKLSFFEKILEELKKTFNDENNGSTTSSSTLASSSPVMEFLGNYVMDQAV